MAKIRITMFQNRLRWKPTDESVGPIAAAAAIKSRLFVAINFYWKRESRGKSCKFQRATPKHQF